MVTFLNKLFTIYKVVGRIVAYLSVPLKSQGLKRNDILIVGSVFPVYACSSDASVGEAYPTAPLLFR
jgi:hypothetical protein